ncbi:hypothetical protein AVEN_115226-1 [Araneus ventricosus]|uniref:Uncharacterized protein n=1 Tax=Araneus ventricosus TaxID=182803 RepID=A0A4Y1ZXP3_ARAVE|nr:hypothetical protein AVEN_115226-1 [Araneus ventricosus]
MWDSLREALEPISRARTAHLGAEFMRVKYQPPETMAVFLGRLKQAKDRLEAVGKKIDNDEYAYQMLMNLPAEHGNIAQQLYLLDDNGFTPENVKKKLISEYDRLRYENLNEAGPSYNETDSNLMLARKKKVPNKFPGWLRTKEDSNTEANLKAKDEIGKKAKRLKSYASKKFVP